MKIKQVSVFLENKPGHLYKVCQRLADAGINLITQSLADTEQFGILRLIVEDWEKAQQLMLDDGRVVRLVDVVATEVRNEPGGLADVLKVLDDTQINVEYMYVLTSQIHNKAILIFRFDKIDEAIEALQNGGIHLLSPEDLFASQR